MTKISKLSVLLFFVLNTKNLHKFLRHIIGLLPRAIVGLQVLVHKEITCRLEIKHRSGFIERPSVPRGRYVSGTFHGNVVVSLGC